MKPETARLLSVGTALYWYSSAVDAYGYPYVWHHYVSIPAVTIPEFSITPYLPYIALFVVAFYWYVYICVSWEFVDSPSWMGGYQ